MQRQHTIGGYASPGCGDRLQSSRDSLSRRLGGAGMVVDVSLSAVLLVDVTVRDVNVVHSRMVVLVGMSGQQMAPVLSLVQIVRDVVVLVPVLQGFVGVVTLRPRHRPHLSP